MAFHPNSGLRNEGHRSVSQICRNIDLVFSLIIVYLDSFLENLNMVQIDRSKLL